MKQLGILLAVLALTACAKDGDETRKTTNEHFDVVKLFEHEGCTVYRFYDVGRYVHYTNCSGSTIWTESCGKNCTRTVQVPNAGRRP